MSKEIDDSIWHQSHELIIFWRKLHKQEVLHISALICLIIMKHGSVPQYIPFRLCAKFGDMTTRWCSYTSRFYIWTSARLIKMKLGTITAHGPLRLAQEGVTNPPPGDALAVEVQFWHCDPNHTKELKFYSYGCYRLVSVAHKPKMKCVH